MARISAMPAGWTYASSIPWETPSSLDALHGPLTGLVTVPARIDTGLHPVYDVADPWRRYELYERVVRDGLTREQEAWLRKDVLVALWPNFILPRECRQAWEDKFPELRVLRESRR